MLEVFTVGGGDYLVNTFNAVSAWTGSGGFKSLIRVVMVMGLIFALTVTAFNLDWRAWFRWFLQATLIYSCLMVPTVDIKVTDRINPGLAPATVANVPLGLGMMASFTSQVSDYFTRQAETVFVMPSSLQYSNGGIVYGARLWDKVRSFEIKDPVFRANLDAHFKQCVFYDILYGNISMRTLSDSTDMWVEIGNNPAVNRAQKYMRETGGTFDIEYVTCRDAYSALTQSWNTYLTANVPKFARTFYPKLTEAAANARLANDVPVVSQLLHGTAKTAPEVLRQKSLVDAFAAAQLDFGNDEADGFALERADTQARNSMTSVAQQAMVWVPVLNIVLTLVFYAMFPVIFPLFLFPRTGIPALKGYLAGFFYLAAWGPLYVLLHMFIMDRIANEMAAAAPGGISLAGWGGIQAVNQDTATLAGFLIMSVPALAAMLARGAMAASNSAAGFLQSVQSGGEAAALERTTGNYAYGDVSFSNFNGNNRQANQWTEAGNYFAGAMRNSFRGSDGVTYSEYGNGRTVIDSSGGISQLPFKPMMTAGYASDLRMQGQNYLNEADRIENGTSTTWSSSKSAFTSAVSTNSSVTGDRSESGKQSSFTKDRREHRGTEGSVGVSERTSTNNGLRISQGNNLSSTFSATDTTGLSGSASASAKIGTPLGGIVGSEANVGISGSVFARRENTDVSSRTNSRGLETFTTRATDNSEDNSGRFSLGTTDSSTSSSGSFTRNSSYSDKSRSESSATGTESRTSEADERRVAASRYREIGNRLVAEASYAQSNGFQMSSDLSNLVQDRYEELRRQQPELHLPDLANPNLSLTEMQRRDQGVTAVMADLLSDLRSRKLSELGDVAGIGIIGTLGSNADLGMPSASSIRSIAVDEPGSAASLPDAPESNVDGRPYARELGIGLKRGTNIKSIDGDMIPAMAAVASEAQRLGLPKPVITSGNDSTHTNGSAHYDDRGLDFRGKTITVEQGRQWADGVSDTLGKGYGVQFEVFPNEPDRNHLHVSRRKN
ncbi:conjugal transfer protein TraG N-terminal domain-containing protein [Sphingorhabdus buctiana]|uniref:Conjugal transfer protein TraG N-terminal domain-containing protein n=1 Tax=Sphingorhabdus buctiana TaxID=1508805 RepID=A0ABW4MA27_9SPHN